MEELVIVEWNVGMSALAAILLVVGALVIGAISQFIGEPRIGFEWLFTAAGVLVGGWLGSEAFGTASTWGPEFEGLYILPALIGGVILGAVVDVIVRFATGGTYTHEPRPI
jgi:uncharacterized membrane protein YeaQ/YmgE (transglycosylase-associated protein family)